jgi:hypothetical protein
MSRRKAYGNADHEYIVSAITNRKEMEREFNVVAYTTIGFGDRLGVLVIRSEVRETGQSLSTTPLCSLTAEWPNAAPIGWTPFLMDHFSKLYRLAEDSKRDDLAFFEGDRQPV